jgi:hypothetical protein
MRYPLRLTVVALCLCVTFSCRQTLLGPHPGHHPGENTISINVIYPNTDTVDYGNSFELIVSEPGGKILIDSLAPYNVPIVTTVTTSKSLVDLTEVVYSPTFDFYSMSIDKSVTPQNGAIYLGGPLPISYPTAIPGTITYTHAPLVDQNTLHFASRHTTSDLEPSISSYTSNELDFNYSGLSGPNAAYIIFPSLGQYDYQPISAINDTISLAQMDTTVKVHVSMPPQYLLALSWMNGYPDTSDYSTYLTLYDYFEPVAIGDLQYPPRSRVPMQKYSLMIDASTANNEFLSYSTYGVTPPTGTVTPPFPTTPIYTLNSTTNDSFSVSFAQLPTSYSTSWSAGNISISIGNPPDSTHVRALALVSSLHSKLLQGKSLSGLAIQNFGYATIPGLLYSGYFTPQTNPVANLTSPYASTLSYFIFLN